MKGQSTNSQNDQFNYTVAQYKLLFTFASLTYSSGYGTARQIGRSVLEARFRAFVDAEEQGTLGCGGDSKLSYTSEMSCIISVFDKYAITAACLMMFPVLLQIPAAYFATLLRTWVIEVCENRRHRMARLTMRQEKRSDVVVQCRISQGFGLIVVIYPLLMTI
eukprot:755642-Hanusia_phi.AAC.8